MSNQVKLQVRLVLVPAKKVQWFDLDVRQELVTGYCLKKPLVSYEEPPGKHMLSFININSVMHLYPGKL